MTHDERVSLPPVLDVPTAGRVLGTGRSLAYELVRTGAWPPRCYGSAGSSKSPPHPFSGSWTERRETMPRRARWHRGEASETDGSVGKVWVRSFLVIFESLSSPHLTWGFSSAPGSVPPVVCPR